MLLLLVYGGVKGVEWWRARPYRMPDNTFNIVVAQFQENGADSEIAQAYSTDLHDYLLNQYQLSAIGSQVSVQHVAHTIIHDQKDVRWLVDTTNGDIVIFGTVLRAGNQLQITPQFYVGEGFRMDAAEMVGQQSLGSPEVYSGDEILNKAATLRDKTRIIVEFTIGLSYLSTNHPKLADKAIDDAIHYADKHDYFAGKEVIYMFAAVTSTILGDYDHAEQHIQQALDVNPSFGRAYIAMGNIYYSRADQERQANRMDLAQEDFSTALGYYQRALDMRAQTDSAFVYDKAHLSVGNVYAFEYQIASAEDQGRYAEQAFRHYQMVIDDYRESGDDGLHELAANAYYSISIIYQGQQQYSAARSAIQQALAITDDPNLSDRAERRLVQIDRDERSDEMER